MQVIKGGSRSQASAVRRHSCSPWHPIGQPSDLRGPTLAEHHNYPWSAQRNAHIAQRHQSQHGHTGVVQWIRPGATPLPVARRLLATAMRQKSLAITTSSPHHLRSTPRSPATRAPPPLRDQQRQLRGMAKRTGHADAQNDQSTSINLPPPSAD